MAVSNAEANWEGSLKEGKGGMKLGSGALSAPFSFGTRFEGAAGTNPEELIGAALAGCFSMALSAGLGKGGFTPTKINTTAKVHLEKVGEGFKITRIQLNTDATIPNIDDAKFQEAAEATKKGCPVSQALTGTSIELTAKLNK
jgi:osmotically inducible protein OsmC